MNKILLKDLTTKIGSGATPRGGDKAYQDEGVALIRSQNVLDFAFSKSGLAYISESQARDLDNVNVQTNDVLLNITGDSIARACKVPDDILPARVNQHVAIVRVKHDIDSNYILYYLQYLKPYLFKICGVGGTRNALTKDAVEKLEIVLLDGHERIGKMLSLLDSKISLNNRINAGLEAMAKTIYDYWFVQFDFPTPSPSGRAGVGSPYKASGGKMVWSEELKRELPEGWGVGTVNDLGEIIGGSTPSTKDEENFENDGTPWITPKDLSLNVGNKFITKGEVSVSKRGIEKASLKVMPEGTILLSSRAPIGYMAISRQAVTTNQGFKNIVPNKGYSTEIVYYLIKNLIPVIEKNSSGSTFKEISGSVLKSIKVLLPHKNQATSLTDILSPIFRKQNLLELENQKLTELRDWLLPMLMNRQIKIKDAGRMASEVLGKNEDPDSYREAMAAEPATTYQKRK
jgi:type I restriction enzyme S subunit